MPQPAEATLPTELPCERSPLQDQVEAAVSDGTTPISRLLRLMSAIDSDVTANENVRLRETMRLRLRDRIGAPRSV